MARLIDADAMRQDWLENGENEYVYDTNAVLDSIDEQPTVDAELVHYGWWVTVHKGYDNWVECSECHTVGSPFWKRCPLCEAKMDGDGNAKG